MKWEKLGRIFQASQQTQWMHSYTAMPMALPLGGDRYRIYFGARSIDNSPSVCYIELDINEPKNTLKVSEGPVLSAGQPGYFDDNGLYPGSILKVDEKVLMYYMGRSNGQNGLYYMAIGLAESLDNGLTFTKVSEAPILGRTHFDPWMVTTPWVVKTGEQWRMWYTSGIGWSSDLKNSYYHIKYTESDDGIRWQESEEVAIPLQGNETNVAAPTMLYEDGIYHMWFSFVASKEESYQLGYAISEDGRNWLRKPICDELKLSTVGWDSQCMAYPCVFKHGDSLFMLYSGNELGKHGIGLAVRDE